MDLAQQGIRPQMQRVLSDASAVARAGRDEPLHAKTRQAKGP